MSLTRVDPSVALNGWFNRAHVWADMYWSDFVPLVVAAALLPAAAGVLARSGAMDQVLSARATQLTHVGAVQSERARLAADLHDVVAHHVSLIAVRAETAPYSEKSINPAGRAVLAEIADDARRALDELRGVLGVLHRADASPELAPQPSIRDLPDLVLRSTRAGDRVLADGIDAPWIVPDTVGYVVYRVVQEALTNARRYAQGGPVELRLARDGDELEVAVTNEPGRSTVPPGSDSGVGLVTMAERVEAIGGYLVAGPTAGGGFRVTARVPVADSRLADTRG
ncbi:MAG: histidine kinase [Actinomycetota bacterium]|nr:histidine kinase [Actinomycetota bacterium]